MVLISHIIAEPSRSICLFNSFNSFNCSASWSLISMFDRQKLKHQYQHLICHTLMILQEEKNKITGSLVPRVCAWQGAFFRVLRDSGMCGPAHQKECVSQITAHLKMFGAVIILKLGAQTWNWDALIEQLYDVFSCRSSNLGSTSFWDVLSRCHVQFIAAWPVLT